MTTYNIILVSMIALAIVVFILAKFGFPVIMDITHSLQQPNQTSGVTGGLPALIETIAKAAVAAVPYVGGSAVSIWSDLQAKQIERKIQRFSELIMSMQSDLKKIEDDINENFVAVNDCQDVFEKMSKLVVNERIREKRILYKNAYLHSMTSKIVDFDALERDLRIIEQLNTLEIHLLRLFDNPEAYNKSRGNIIKKPFINEDGTIKSSSMVNYSMVAQIRIFFSKDIEDSDIIESLNFLSQNRILINNVQLLQLRTNGNPIEIFNNVLTDRGKRFVQTLRDL